MVQRAAGDSDAERGRRWVEPLVRDAQVRRDLLKVLGAIDSSHTLAAAERLRAFDRPALIIWSRDDRIFPMRHAERLASDLPDAQLEAIDDSRAFVPLDQPARTAHLIEAFVNERVRQRVGPRG